MPMVSVNLIPGVNTEKTLAANEAGVSQAQLLRYKDGMIQTMGGWASILGVTVPSTVRDLHAWQDISAVDWLSAAATNNLIVATSSASYDVTPQTITSNVAPNVSISSGSQLVTIVDANSGPSVYNTVYFNTPISIGNLFLNGAYPITSVLSTGSYIITSSVAASTTITSSGKLPTFNTTLGSAIVTVNISNNNFTTTLGSQQSFRAPTTVDGLVITGAYQISSIIDSTAFTITATTQASSTNTATMNSSLAQYVYYVTLGPPPTGIGFGGGGFGTGGFGTGAATAGTPGTPITAIDWSEDNWGEVLLACPKDGAIYTWSPHSGFQNTQVINQAPFFNGGIFVSMPQQILVAWKSIQSTGTQDNLIVRWSNALDYTNWTVSNQTTAGSFHIPTGSVIVGGMQAPNYGVIWTDIDVWIMQYIGGDIIFNFTRAGAGCGLIGQHAAGVIAGEVYWCGKSSFFKLGSAGVEPVQCTVWDYIFQNMNPTYAYKIRCCPNSAFNEISWEFPSINAIENDSYVKYNILEKEWDYGLMSRTAWIDVSVLGNPISTDTNGTIFQHETGQAFPGTPVTSFRTGWWAIADGNELSFVDWLLPDFKWSLYSGAQDSQINITIFAADYPGDTPRSYGPFTVTQATEYINPRLRGRLMSMLVQSNNNIFWRLGRIRYRVAPSGRR